MIRILRVSLFIVLAVAMHFTIHFFSTNTFNKITIEGIFPRSGELSIFIAKQFHGFPDVSTISKTIEGNASPQTISVILNNREVRQLKFEYPMSEASTAIQNIVLEGFFQKKSLKFSVENSIKQTNANLNVQAIKTIDHEQKHVFIVEYVDPEKNIFLLYVFPLFLSLIIISLFKNFSIRKQIVFQDLNSTELLRGSHNYLALDGLRGLAAIMVLLEHTMPQFIGLGRAGVWLFFVLSGFLLSRNFIITPVNIFTVEGMTSYFKRRVLRMLPMFYFMVTILMLVQGDTANAMRHYLLIQGDGHFWTILHEIYFYLFLPILALVCHFLFGRKVLFSIAFLFIVSLLYHFFIDEKIMSIYGLGIKQQPYFEVFIVGMIAGYIYYGGYKRSDFFQLLIKNLDKKISIFSLLCFFMFVFYSSNLGMIEEDFDIYLMPFVSAIFCALLILASVLTSNDHALNRFLSCTAFRLVGIVGYSFYLIHPYAIGIFENAVIYLFAVSATEIFPNFITMIVSFCMTLCLSIFTYTYIERPFLLKKMIK